MHTIFVTNELQEDYGERLISPLLRKYGIKNSYIITGFRGTVYELHEPLPRVVDILKVTPAIQMEIDAREAYKATARYGFGLAPLKHEGCAINFDYLA